MCSIHFRTGFSVILCGQKFQCIGRNNFFPLPLHPMTGSQKKWEILFLLWFCFVWFLFWFLWFGFWVFFLAWTSWDLSHFCVLASSCQDPEHVMWKFPSALSTCATGKEWLADIVCQIILSNEPVFCNKSPAALFDQLFPCGAWSWVSHH